MTPAPDTGSGTTVKNKPSLSTWETYYVSVTGTDEGAPSSLMPAGAAASFLHQKHTSRTVEVPARQTEEAGKGVSCYRGKEVVACATQLGRV